MKATDAIIRLLQRHGIDRVFGYPGGTIMPLYDSLSGSGVEHVLCRHEQGCAFAANGYARVSGKAGVCLATSGPGATNLITGVADAHRDSVPMVVITGQVASAMIGTDAFQETDMLGMTLDIVKHSYLVTEADDLPGVLEEALRLATSGRPGPVWIDLPKDIQAADVTLAPAVSGTQRDNTNGARDSRAVLEALRTAQRPILYSGGGVTIASAENALRRFAEVSGIPSVVTLKGLGNTGRHDPWHLGMIGMHGSPAANLATDECDLLFVVGARLDDRATGEIPTFAPNARLIHLDADPAELHKLRRADIGLNGSPAPVLERLTEALSEEPLAIGHWQQQCRQWQKQYRAASHCSDIITGPAFLRTLSGTAPDELIIACDVGQHQMWVAQHYAFSHPRDHLTSGGLGAMGFGLPAAMGAAYALPGRRVLNLTGDGSFMFNLQELATIRRDNLNVGVVIMDNECLGMVRQHQELFFNDRESAIGLDDNPDFTAIARGFGIPAASISHPDEMEAGIDQLLNTQGPFLLHVMVPREDNVWPMVRPGGSNRHMIHSNRDNRETLS